MAATTRNEAFAAIEGEGAELRTKDIGGEMTVAFARLAKGTDLAPALKGLPDDLCPCPHWGYVLKGRLKMLTGAGSQAYEVYEEGQAFYWPPGHAPQALEDCEYVDFSPTKEFDRVVDHIKSQAG